MSELYKTIPAGSLPTLSMALAELLNKHYLILLGNRTYSVYLIATGIYQQKLLASG